MNYRVSNEYYIEYHPFADIVEVELLVEWFLETEMKTIHLSIRYTPFLDVINTQKCFVIDRRIPKKEFIPIITKLTEKIRIFTNSSFVGAKKIVLPFGSIGIQLNMRSLLGLLYPLPVFLPGHRCDSRLWREKVDVCA